MFPVAYFSNEIVVSASRHAQSLHLAPASAAIITKDAIKSSGIQSMDDAFHDVNGVIITRSSGSNVQSLSIRGSSEVAGGGIGNRVLLLLDGRPAITPESGGALWNLVPLGALERIEVIKGAYSSLFGSSAMGGIVNLITRLPDTVAHTDISISGGFYEPPTVDPGYKKTGLFSHFDVFHSGRKSKLSYLLNASSRLNEGHRQRTAFSSYNAYGKLRYTISDRRYITISGMYNDIFNHSPATWLAFNKPYQVAAFKKDDTQHRSEWNIDLGYYAWSNHQIKYTNRFYYYGANSEYVFDPDPMNDSTNVNKGKQSIDDEQVYVTRLGLISQVDFDIKDNYIVAGIELNSDHVDGRPDTILYGVHQAWNAGIFIQDEWKVNRKLIVTGGARYDYYNIRGTFMQGNISPKIAAVYKLKPNVSVRALLARAFRNPSIAERYTKFEQGGGLRFQPSPNLKAEVLTLSAEVGTKFTLLQDLRADIALYYNRYKNLITYRQLPTPDGSYLFAVINLNNAMMQGIEINLDYQPLSWLTLTTGYTFLDAKDMSKERFNDVLPYKPKHTWYGSATASKGKFSFQFRARSRSKLDEVFIYHGSEPDGYLLLKGMITYRPSKSIQISFDADNLTNTQYEEIERYRMPGRNYTTTVRFSI